MTRTAVDAELLEHAGGEIEAALVRIEAEDLVGVVGVVALRLELVGADLVGDAVPASFLVEIEQDAALVLGHVAHGVAQLVAAIAFEAAEEVARQAGRMQAHGHGLGQIGIARR